MHYQQIVSTCAILLRLSQPKYRDRMNDREKIALECLSEIWLARLDQHVSFDNEACFQQFINTGTV
jgi:hypothetical protein